MTSSSRAPRRPSEQSSLFWRSNSTTKFWILKKPSPRMLPRKRMIYRASSDRRLSRQRLQEAAERREATVVAVSEESET